MNPFEPGQSTEVPLPPFDIPTPELPPNDFVAVGRDIAKGHAESGWIDTFWRSLTAFLADYVGSIAIAIIGLFSYFAVYVARIFLIARKGNEKALAEASAAAVGDLFGIDVQTDWFSQLQNNGQRREMAKNAAEGVLEALGGSFNPTPTGALQPDSLRAEHYVTTVMNLAVEGWLEGWMMEALSAGQLETFAELKDTVASVLGLGRLTRQVLAPVVKVLIQEPFTWKLNNAYRSVLYKESTAVRQFLRGRMSRAQLDTELGYQGYSAERIEGLINEASLHLPVGDLSTLVVHNELDATAAQQLLKDQGYSDTQAAMALRIEHLRRGDTLTYELARTAIEAWTLGNIDTAHLDLYLNTDSLTDQEKTALGQLRDLKSLTKRKQFSIAQAQTMVEKGIWSLDRFATWAAIEGYTPDDERDLELLLFSKIASAAEAAKAKADHAKTAAEKAAAAALAAQAKKVAATAALANKGVTLAKYETLVKDGIRTLDQYKAYLTSLGVSADNQAALVEVLTAAITKAQTAGTNKAAHSATAAAKNLNLGELDKAVRAGIVSLDEYKARLEGAGFAAADVDILVAVAQSDLESIATRAATKVEAKASAAVKHIDLAQEERAVRLGLKKLQDFTAFLSAHGYADADAQLLTDELAAQLATDKAAQVTRAQATAKATTKGLSLATLERAVRAGVKTIEDYSAELAALGYSGDAQAAMVQLLQLTLDTDAQTLAARGQASAILGQRGVSLLDLERAVRVGVVPMSVYTDALGRAGLSTDDANLLTLTLAAQVAAQRKAAKPSVVVNTALKAAGLSLTKLEADVLKGTLTIDQFNTTLLGAGIDAATVAALVTVVNDELANQQAIAAKVGDVAARAKAKGLDLSQEVAAVKANVKTIDDFSAFVLSLGFDDADAATLTATLKAQLGKAAAAKTPAPATPPSTPA